MVGSSKRVTEFWVPQNIANFLIRRGNASLQKTSLSTDYVIDLYEWAHV